VLSDIAKNDKSEYVREAVVEKLTDQTVLADIAKNNEYASVRIIAIANLIMQNLLKEALESIYCFKYDTEDKINLANILVNLAKKSDRPLKAQWRAIKSWVKMIPDIPHEDMSNYDCHRDIVNFRHTELNLKTASPCKPLPL
jgi:hypothetical protein